MEIVQVDGLSIRLENNNSTATIIDSSNSYTHFFIPKSIDYENHEYFITSIGPDAFKGKKKLKTITFAADSRISLIDKNSFSSCSLKIISIPDSITKINDSAFSGCKNLRSINISQTSQLYSICNNCFDQISIKTIYFPPSLINLDIEWCNGLLYLTNIIVSPDNHRYKFYNKTFLLERTNIKSDTYEILRFAQRDIQNAVIPSFVKVIAPFSFSFCKKLETIEFSEDSELETIESSAFKNSTLEKINIPSKVTSIGTNCFQFCKKLKTVNFSENSELRKIGASAFESSAVSDVKLPRRVTQIDELCFSNCSNIKSFEFSVRKSSRVCSVQSNFINGSNFDSIVVPSQVAVKGDSLLNGCYKLKTAEFLGSEVTLNGDFFKGSWGLFIVSFPDSTTVKFNSFELKNISPLCMLFFRPYTDLYQNLRKQ